MVFILEASSKQNLKVFSSRSEADEDMRYALMLNPTLGTGTWDRAWWGASSGERRTSSPCSTGACTFQAPPLPSTHCLTTFVTLTGTSRRVLQLPWVHTKLDSRVQT